MTNFTDLKLWKQKAIYLHKILGKNGTEIALEINVPKRTVYDNLSKWSNKFSIEEVQDAKILFEDDIDISRKPKILFLDIEKTFSISGHFPQWDTNLHQDAKFRESHILSYSYAINDEEVKGNILSAKELHSDVINSFANDTITTEIDKGLVEELWILLDYCDIVVAYNGKGYDIKEIQASFLKYDLPPPSPFKVIDPMLIAKRKFRLPFKSMKYLANYLNVTQKIDNSGLSLWKQVMLGDEISIQEMMDYNKGDVVTLREVYYKLRGWDNDGVNLAIYDDKHDMLCPHCGSHNIRPMDDKFTFTHAKKYYSYRCNECQAVLRSNKSPNKVGNKLYRIV